MSPLTDEMDITVVGGRFGGLIIEVRFREPDFDRVRIIEKGGNFDGTWYWNRCPGAPAALKPCYRQSCKRPCFHDEHLPTFGRESVHLVDTTCPGVEAITGNGIFANGQKHEVDCIIFAMGFEVGTEYTRPAGYDVIS